MIARLFPGRTDNAVKYKPCYKPCAKIVNDVAAANLVAPNAAKAVSMENIMEASTAKYIVQQYLAATGGQSVLNAVNSMYAVGQLKMVSSDIHQISDIVNAKRNCEVGGFVLWQKNPDLWFLELVVSGCKVSAGSDGKVAWSQSSSYPSQSSKGPPRPLRCFFQA